MPGRERRHVGGHAGSGLHFAGILREKVGFEPRPELRIRGNRIRQLMAQLQRKLEQRIRYLFGRYGCTTRELAIELVVKLFRVVGHGRR